MSDLPLAFRLKCNNLPRILNALGEPLASTVPIPGELINDLLIDAEGSGSTPGARPRPTLAGPARSSSAHPGVWANLPPRPLSSWMSAAAPGRYAVWLAERVYRVHS